MPNIFYMLLEAYIDQHLSDLFTCIIGLPFWALTWMWFGVSSNDVLGLSAAMKEANFNNNYNYSLIAYCSCESWI